MQKILNPVEFSYCYYLFNPKCIIIKNTTLL